MQYQGAVFRQAVKRTSGAISGGPVHALPCKLYHELNEHVKSKNTRKTPRKHEENGRKPDKKPNSAARETKPEPKREQLRRNAKHENARQSAPGSRPDIDYKRPARRRKQRLQFWSPINAKRARSQLEQ